MIETPGDCDGGANWIDLPARWDELFCHQFAITKYWIR